MRLRRLVLPEFDAGRPLHLRFANPELPLDHGMPRISFFVGLNGTGKSRALTALGLIFSHLAIEERPGIDFELEYEVGNRGVLVTTLTDTAARSSGGTVPPQVTPGLWIFNGSESAGWKARDRWPSSPREWLPARVLGYSTGPVTRLEWALARSPERIVTERATTSEHRAPDVFGSAEQERYGVQQQRQAEALRQAFLDNPIAVAVGAEDALLAALALLAHPGPSSPGPNELRALVLQRLGLASDMPLAAFSIDLPAGWRDLVSGRPAEVLADLLQSAERRIAIDLDGARGIRAVFELGDSLTAALRRNADTPLVLFDYLHAWWRRGAVVAGHLVLGKQEIEDRLLDDDLSDGEFLFLGRYALLVLLAAEPDVLVLLDEPETHFNDRWKVDLVSEISAILGAPHRADGLAGEVLIATHSDLTLTDADRACVYVFRMVGEGADRKLEVGLPTRSPFAADRADIAADMFDGVSTIGTYSLERIDQAVSLTDPDELRRIVASVGPGFHRFRLQMRLDELEGGDAAEAE